VNGAQRSSDRRCHACAVAQQALIQGIRDIQRGRCRPLVSATPCLGQCTAVGSSQPPRARLSQSRCRPGASGSCRCKQSQSSRSTIQKAGPACLQLHGVQTTISDRTASVGPSTMRLLSQSHAIARKHRIRAGTPRAGVTCKLLRSHKQTTATRQVVQHRPRCRACSALTRFIRS